MVNYNSCVGDCSVLWDCANVSVREVKNCISSFGDTRASLRQTVEFFAHCVDPQIFEEGILDQFSVVGDGFLCDRMYNAITVFFNANEGARILVAMFCKRGRDCVDWGIGESKTDDVVQGLARNVARGSAGDESGGASWH